MVCSNSYIGTEIVAICAVRFNRPLLMRFLASHSLLTDGEISDRVRPRTRRRYLELFYPRYYVS
jgi:hypothetical protein